MTQLQFHLQSKGPYALSELLVTTRNLRDNISALRVCTEGLGWEHRWTHLHHLEKRERLLWKKKKVGEGDNRGWDGWMASLTQWTWVWTSSRSWWWRGKPGTLQSTGSQSQTQLSWKQSRSGFVESFNHNHLNNANRNFSHQCLLYRTVVRNNVWRAALSGVLQRKEAPHSISGIKWVVSKFSSKRLDFVEKRVGSGNYTRYASLEHINKEARIQQESDPVT